MVRVGGSIFQFAVTLYIAVSCTWGVGAHYLPLDLCDFYFQGHKESAPMLDFMGTRNLTYSPAVLTKDDKPVKVAQMRATCAFLSDPTMIFGMQQKCAGHFRVRKYQLSGRFAHEENSPFEDYRIHEVLLPFERIELQDGTVLDAKDNNKQYIQPRRCLTFLTTPVADHMRTSRKGTDKEDVITRVEQMVPRMLNNAHRKKLKKLDESAGQLRRDFTSFFENLANLP